MPGTPPSWWSIFKERSQLDRKKSGGGGGGGKSKVQMGRAGPRGRRFPIVRVPMRRTVIVKSKFIANNKNANKRLSMWINYQVKEKELEKDKEKNRGLEPVRQEDRSREPQKDQQPDRQRQAENQQNENEPQKLPPELLREKGFLHRIGTT